MSGELKTTYGPEKKVSPALIVFLAILCLVGGGIGVSALTAKPVPADTRSYGERRADEIKAGCAREFPHDEYEQRACAIEIMSRELEEDRARKLERAAGR